jgi:hypothetical protein
MALPEPEDESVVNVTTFEPPDLATALPRAFEFSADSRQSV